MAGMHRGKSGVDRVERPRPSAFAQYRALLAKDVRQELRTREMLTSMIVSVSYTHLALPTTERV